MAVCHRVGIEDEGVLGYQSAGVEAGLDDGANSLTLIPNREAWCGQQSNRSVSDLSPFCKASGARTCFGRLLADLYHNVCFANDDLRLNSPESIMEAPAFRL
jgi:hypothetical protein